MLYVFLLSANTGSARQESMFKKKLALIMLLYIEILLANSSYKYCTPLTDDSVSVERVFVEGKAELCNLSNSLVTIIHWEEHENAIISLWKMLGL